MKTLNDFKSKKFADFHFDFENDGFTYRPKKTAKVYAVSMEHLAKLVNIGEFSLHEFLSIYEVKRVNVDAELLQVVGVIKKDDVKKQKKGFNEDDKKVFATLLIRGVKRLKGANKRGK